MSPSTVTIENGEDLPQYLYEALGMSYEQDRKVGNIVMAIEKEGGTIADGLLKLINNKELKKNEKIYAAYRMAERALENNPYGELLTNEERNTINQIGGRVLGLIE